jgi:phosphate:Na+ symporter
MQEMSHPLTGLLVGAIFTAVIQSSAATLAIIITLGSQGVITLESGVALMLGANVGTCGTALIASLGKSKEALQVSVVHLIFNLLGVLFFIFIIPAFSDFIRVISPSAYDLKGTEQMAAEMPHQIANAHTIFSLFSTAVLIGFTGAIEKLVIRLIPTHKSRDIR